MESKSFNPFGGKGPFNSWPSPDAVFLQDLKKLGAFAEDPRLAGVNPLVQILNPEPRQQFYLEVAQIASELAARAWENAEQLKQAQTIRQALAPPKKRGSPPRWETADARFAWLAVMKAAALAEKPITYNRAREIVAEQPYWIQHAEERERRPGPEYIKAGCAFAWRFDPSYNPRDLFDGQVQRISEDPELKKHWRDLGAGMPELDVGVK